MKKIKRILAVSGAAMMLFLSSCVTEQLCPAYIYNDSGEKTIMVSTGNEVQAKKADVLSTI